MVADGQLALVNAKCDNYTSIPGYCFLKKKMCRRVEEHLPKTGQPNSYPGGYRLPMKRVWDVLEAIEGIFDKARMTSGE